MRIGQLSQATGIGIETIRYYEKVGLLPDPARLPNGYRDYGPGHLDRLAFIRQCRSLDISIADIARLLDFRHGSPTDCDAINQLIDEHLAQIRTQIVSMRALESQLIELRKRCSKGKRTPDCGILNELTTSARGKMAIKRFPSH